MIAVAHPGRLSCVTENTPDVINITFAAGECGCRRRRALRAVTGNTYRTTAGGTSTPSGRGGNLGKPCPR